MVVGTEPERRILKGAALLQSSVMMCCRGMCESDWDAAVFFKGADEGRDDQRGEIDQCGVFNWQKK